MNQQIQESCVLLPFKFRGMQSYNLKVLFDTGATLNLARYNAFPPDVWNIELKQHWRGIYAYS